MQDLFNPDDFNTMRIRVQIDNQTSKTRVGLGSRQFGGDLAVESPEHDVRIREINAKTLALDVPARTAAQGHLLNILIEPTGLPGAQPFMINCRAESCEDVGGARDRLVVELLEPRDPNLDVLRRALNNRQGEIDAFLSAMRR